MKKIAILVVCIFFLGCSRNDNLNNCNFLLNVGVNIPVNLNLFPYNQLANPGNSVMVNGQGNAGIIITRTNSTTLRAWDAADPNHPFRECSRLVGINDPNVNDLIIPSLNVICSCDDGNEYNLITGQSLGVNQQPCTLKEYRVDFIGNNQYAISN